MSEWYQGYLCGLICTAILVWVFAYCQDQKKSRAVSALWAFGIAFIVSCVLDAIGIWG